MLDALFRSSHERKQSQDDLRALVEQARAERARLAEMLQQLNAAPSTLTRTSRGLDDLRIKADEVARRCEKAEKNVDSVRASLDAYEAIEGRLAKLVARIEAAEAAADALLAPDGGLQQIRRATEEMGARTRGRLGELARTFHEVAPEVLISGSVEFQVGCGA